MKALHTNPTLPTDPTPTGPRTNPTLPTDPTPPSQIIPITHQTKNVATTRNFVRTAHIAQTLLTTTIEIS